MSYDLGTAHGTIVIDYDGKRDVDRAERDMERVGDSSKDTDRELSKLGKTLGKLFSGVGTAAKFGALAVVLTQAGAAAGNLVVEILGMVPALTSILSLSAAIPGAIVAIGASLGILKAAFAGIEEAVKAAFNTKDPEKFNEAIKDLSPSAQAFAKALQANAKGLRQYQQDIQEAFFKTSDLRGGLLSAIGVLKAIRPSVLGVATDFGRATQEVERFALGAQSVQFVQDALVSFRKVLQSVTPTLTPILAGLRAVGEVGLPLLEQLGTAAANVGSAFAVWLNDIASDGRLQGWIDEALATVRQLFTIVGNLGATFNNLFNIAGSTGANLLNTLERITGAMRAFTESAEGQEQLRKLFVGLATVAAQLTPIITTLVGALAGALGPALAELATNTGPILLKMVQELAPAFGPLANALADLLVAVAPLLPPLAELVAMLVGELSNAVSALAAELGPLISLFADGLVQALDALQPAFQAFLQFLPQAVDFGVQLADAFKPVIPLLVQLADTLGQALLENLPQLQAASADLIPQIIELAQAFADFLVAVLPLVNATLPSLVEAYLLVGTAIQKVYSFVINVITAIVNFVTAVVNAVKGLAAFAAALRAGFDNAFASAKTAVQNGIATVVTFFAELPARVVGAIASFVSGFPRITQQTLNKAAFAVGAGIGTMISFFAQLPGRAVSAVASLLSRLRAFLTSLFAMARGVAATGISGTVALFATLPGRSISAIATLGGRLRALASSALASMRSAIAAGISLAISIFTGFPGRARGGMGNLGGQLVSAGRDLVMGLVNGIKGAVGAAVSAAVGVGRSVINGIKSTLKIGSPSKITFLFGGWTAEGLADGILAKLQLVKDAAQSLANTVIAPTVGLGGTTALSGTVRAAAASTAGALANAAGVVVNQTVNALPGMSAKQVADYSTTKLRYAVQGATASLPAPLPQEA